MTIFRLKVKIVLQLTIKQKIVVQSTVKSNGKKNLSTAQPQCSSLADLVYNKLQHKKQCVKF